ncbi:hypothetical protein IFR05_015686 [Cadophora sp. M221]|nr:hypothetical protein IFR05_015686 [Cadophora sp. M221]
MIHPYSSQDGNRKMVHAEMQRRIELSAKKAIPAEAKGKRSGRQAQSGTQAKSIAPAPKVVPELIVDKESAAYRMFQNDKFVKNILQYCFLRPDGIVPYAVKYELYTFRPTSQVSINRYVWESRRQSGCDEQCLPHYDGSPEALQYSWSTVPTERDLQCVENGTANPTGLVGLFELPSTTDSTTGAITKRYLQQRGAYPSKVVHKTTGNTTGIFGVALLQTCSRVHQLGCAILYGQNKFVIDTRGSHATSKPLFDNPAQLSVDSLFDMTLHHRGFIREDPLATFFRLIGPKNAAFITRMRIEGSI